MCNSLEERSSPLRSAALHLSTLAEIVIRSVLNAAFPRINLRPVAAFCIISQFNHVHNQILRYYSSLQSLCIFQNAFFFQSFVPDSFPKKKRNFYPDNYPSFHRSNIHDPRNWSISTYLSYIFSHFQFGKMDRSEVNRGSSSKGHPRFRDLDRDKKNNRRRIFLLGLEKRRKKKKRKKRKRNGLAFTGSRKSASIYTTRICTPREDTRERSRTP